MKRYAVAVSTTITKEPQHWWSSEQEWLGLNLYFIDAPNEKVAQALGVNQALEDQEEPGCEVVLQDVESEEIPTVARQEGELR